MDPNLLVVHGQSETLEKADDDSPSKSYQRLLGGERLDWGIALLCNTSSSSAGRDKEGEEKAGYPAHASSSNRDLLMPNAKDRRSNPTPSILVVGDGGTRKTRFIATCPKPFIYDFDNGTASIAGEDVQYETFKDAPYGVKVGPKQKEEGIFEWGTAWPAFIKHLNDNVAQQVETGKTPYGLYALDSLTSLANISMNYVLKSAGKVGTAAPEIQHWGMQLRLLEIVMDQLTALPVPLIVTAHIKRDNNLVSGETVEMLPLVGGQLSGKIGIYFDEVWYTENKVAPAAGGNPGRKFTVFITETGGLRRQAKTRHNVPSGIEAKWSLVAPYFSGEKPTAGQLVSSVQT